MDKATASAKKHATQDVYFNVKLQESDVAVLKELYSNGKVNPEVHPNLEKGEITFILKGKYNDRKERDHMFG